ncbi:MAG: hypothetical protein L3J66_07520 [Bacteroidales bacterium]|nr:hypothetical protein [Bacteroidales bacterium]
MKNKLEHIDKIFLEGAESTTQFSAKKGWRTMKIRLLLSEIMAFNFVNVNWNYVVYAGILLFLFSFSFIYFNRNEIMPQEMSKTISTETAFPKTEKNDNRTPHQTAQTETPQIKGRPETPQISPAKAKPALQNTKSVFHGKQEQKYSKTKPPSYFVSGAQLMKMVQPKKYAGQISGFDELPLAATRNSHLAVSEKLNDVVVYKQAEKRPSRFSLGTNAGSVFLLNESASAEEIRQPLWFGGFNFRYNKARFFVETAIEFSVYKSAVNSTYRYDSLLGTIASSGYDIVEVTNDAGEIVLERQYHSELITVYDTLSSNDEVTITANSSVLCIPLRIGAKIFQTGRFYSAVYAGAVFKILLVKNQSAPGFGSDHRRIIEYETMPVVNYNPEFYFQGGLLFGYDISKSFSLEISASYNHILDGNSTNLQISKSNIKAGFGFNFKF